MSTPFVVVKPHKSTGIAILLVLLCGPFGLFYGSVTGGLIMTFGPVVLLLLMVIGIFTENDLLSLWSLGLILVFALTYWLICIIWAIAGVNSYNSEIDREARRQQDQWQRYNATEQGKVVLNVNHFADKKQAQNFQGQSSVSNAKPSMHDWLNRNPGKSINDYFSKYGH